MLSTVEINQLKQTGLKDPIFFAKTFLPHLLGGDPPGTPNPDPPGRVPWLHQGSLAILLRKTEFLWTYGEVSKIMREFTITRPNILDKDGHPKILGRIFRVFRRDNGEEVNYEEVARLERECSPQDLEAALEIALHVGKNTVLMFPRGFGKTTLAGQIAPIYMFCYQLTKFFTYISETGTHAEMQASNVRSELSSNALLLEVFGGFKPDRNDDTRKWSERLFEALNGVAMAARGRGAQVRGLNNKGNRPTKIILDDIEDEESIKTPEQRKKTQHWTFGAVKPALSKMDKDSSMIFLGTLLGKECLLYGIASDPDFTTVKFSVVDSEGKLVWPEMMGWEAIKKERDSYASKGLLWLFYLEYFNEYIPGDLQEFKREYFQFQVVPLEDIVAWAMWCDPAIGEDRTADRAVITVAGMMKDGRVYMAAEWSVQGEPNMVGKTVKAYFRYAKIFRPLYHGFESNAYQKALESLLSNAMPREQYWFEPLGKVNTKAKPLRIMGDLLPRMSSGFVVWHPSFENGKTMQEALSYNPAIKEQADDGIDSAASVLKVLEPLNPFAETPPDPEDPFPDDEELPIEMVLGDDWRSY